MQFNRQKQKYLKLTATEMAISDSVTVSMGEATSGALRVIFLVRADVRSWNDKRWIEIGNVTRCMK